ncbi:sulfite exporter TauE/SafE family protein [Candidatus Protochlamydia sp. W-9]|uniref:sulfite exporter TauE/SafE family protein n=1 Tax=Candidatus Protochlamydia sp. W-9 TaxID=1785087 RepID=UPI00096A2F91|nr:sulfite exporter TauE/SafE family protein [Candidatus Protochlamydia sp. W-9]
MILVFFGALAVGVSLGLLGSGGSIFTVPILILFLHRPDKLAVAESLAIVGVIALVGAIPYAIRQQVHWRTVCFFGLAGMIGSYIGACISHSISGRVQLFIFGSVMLIVAWIMLKDKKWLQRNKDTSHSTLMSLLSGFLLGQLTGCSGVGGGFIIVPILIVILNLSIYVAIGTSLMIIALNALTAFFQQAFLLQCSGMHVNWKVIALFSLFGVIGSLIGGTIVKYIPPVHLRKFFGTLMLPLGVYILIHSFNASLT